MKNFYIIIIITLFLNACNSDDDVIKENTFSRITEIVSYNSHITGDSIVVGIRDYRLSAAGKVIALKGTLDESDTDWTYFEYNSENRLARLTHDGEVSMEFFWDEDTCHILIPGSGHISTLIYEDENLTHIGSRNFQFSFGNVSSIFYQDTLQSEFLDYNNSVINPLYYLKSVEPWLAWLTLPISKNVAELRRDQPYDGGDYYSPLIDYVYEYKIDDRNNVISISPGWSIYTWYYRYYP